MKGIQGKINKLKLGFKHVHGRIIVVGSREFYSKKHGKTFTCYEVNEVTPEKTIIKEQLKNMRKVYKELKKVKSKERLKTLIERKASYLDMNFMSKVEIFGKVEVLKHLVMFWGWLNERGDRNEQKNTNN